MDKNKIFIIAVTGLMVIAFGVLTARSTIWRPSSFVPPLTVLGDVGEVLTVKDLKEMGKPEKTRIDGTVYKTVKLRELINKAKPQERVKKIFFVAGDGFTAAIDADNLDRNYISFSRDNGWVALNPDHPINANIKLMQEIIVVSDAGQTQNCFTVINGNEVLNTTVGKLYAGPLTSYPYFEGEAKVEHEGIAYTSSIFTRRRVFKLSDLISLGDKARVAVLGENGDYQPVDDRGYYELYGNYLNYIQPETRAKIEKVRLAVIDPPGANIADTYYDARHYMENNEKVLIVMLQGFSYRDYEYAVKNGHAPFLQKNAAAVKAMGFYPLRANVWQASMLTGLSPAENHILSADDRDLKMDTLFSEEEKLGKRGLFLEAGNLLDLKEQTTVSDDLVNDGTDDEVYRRLLQNMNDGYGLVIARFDSIGENSLRFGKKSAQTKKSIAQIDTYLKEIADRWKGKIIVTALPNQESNTAAGALHEDLFVPYLVLSGKAQGQG